MPGLIDDITTKIEESSLVPIDTITGYYGIPYNTLQLTQRILPRLPLLQGREHGQYKKARVAILALALPYPHDELVEVGIRMSQNLRDCVYSSLFHSSIAEADIVKGSDSNSTLGELLYCYTGWLQKLGELESNGDTKEIKGELLHQNHIHFSQDGNPTKRYQIAEIKDEIQGNINLVIDLIGADIPYLSPKRDVLWARYKGASTKTEEINYRNVLIQMYMGLVKKEAKRIIALYPKIFDFNELVNAGVFGLIDALEWFDHTRGTRFEVYAHKMIEGAISDEIRGLNFVPRWAWDRVSQIRDAIDKTTTTTGYRPTEEQLAEALGMQPVEYQELQKNLLFPILKMFWKEFGDKRGLVSLIESLKPNALKYDPFEEVLQRDIYTVCLSNLTDKERFLINAHYHEGKSMREIAILTQSQASTIIARHKAIIRKLKESLGLVEYTTRGRKRKPINPSRFEDAQYTTLTALVQTASTFEIPESRLREIVTSDSRTKDLITEKGRGFVVTIENLSQMIELLNQLTSR